MATTLVGLGLGLVAFLKDPLPAAVVAAAFVVAVALFARSVQALDESYGGLYKFLESRDSWALEEGGAKATNTKTRKVEYLQDEVFALRDYAWASGQVGPCRVIEGEARAVSPYDRDGFKHTIVLLDETRRRGDRDDLKIEWSFTNSFPQETEWVQVDVVHETVQLAIEVFFPLDRPPHKAWLLERVGGQETRSGLPIETESDGRHRVRHTYLNPPRGSAFTISWAWPPRAAQGSAAESGAGDA